MSGNRGRVGPLGQYVWSWLHICWWAMYHWGLAAMMVSAHVGALGSSKVVGPLPAVPPVIGSELREALALDVWLCGAMTAPVPWPSALLLPVDCRVVTTPTHVNVLYTLPPAQA